MAINDTLVSIKDYFLNWHRDNYNILHEITAAQINDITNNINKKADVNHTHNYTTPDDLQVAKEEILNMINLHPIPNFNGWRSSDNSEYVYGYYNDLFVIILFRVVGPIPEDPDDPDFQPIHSAEVGEDFPYIPERFLPKMIISGMAYPKTEIAIMSDGKIHVRRIIKTEKGKFVQGFFFYPTSICPNFEG